MDEDVIRCGNDLRLLEWWLIHHGKDPRYGGLFKELAAVTTGVVNVLVSTTLTNQALGRELRTESAKSFVAAANRLASAPAVNAAAAV